MPTIKLKICECIFVLCKCTLRSLHIIINHESEIKTTASLNSINFETKASKHRHYSTSLDFSEEKMHARYVSSTRACTNNAVSFFIFGLARNAGREGNNELQAARERR